MRLHLLLCSASSLICAVVSYHRGGSKEGLRESTKNSGSSPNIIFILADDLAWGSGNYSTNPDADLGEFTPTLNSWANAGITFTNYYSLEVCTPARASLMTGRYPLTIGMQYGGVEATVSWGLNVSETTIAQVLKREGYSNYMLGKWNLGHFTPELLPVARGFDYMLAYQSGSTRYWSKESPNAESRAKGYLHENSAFVDLIYGDGTCYAGYDGSDLHDYSTYLYRDKAVNVIKHHDYSSSPLFLYLASQAVHDPFDDDNEYPNGVPKSYVGNSVYKSIKKAVKGRKRRQYALALYLLDESLSKIEAAVQLAGQSSNTYFIFTSDNGGCAYAGGRNGPLRGNKGTLFEGGTKVDAILYSSKLSAQQQGTVYSGLSHVSDWFPTMLDIAGISYTAPTGYELDGVSHWGNLQLLDNTNPDAVITSPRTLMLYNYYADVDQVTFDSTGTVRAVRDSQFKYLTAWVDEEYSSWEMASEKEDDDSNLESWGTCEQSNSWKIGTYSEFLFDLVNDPYETNNLWDDKDYITQKNTLRSALNTFYETRKTDLNQYGESKACFVAFRDAGNYIVPWAKHKTEAGMGYPVFKSKGCSTSLISPDSNADVDDDDFSDASPTEQPTHKPSRQPTTKPVKVTSKPTTFRSAPPTAHPSVSKSDAEEGSSSFPTTSPSLHFAASPTAFPTLASQSDIDGPPTTDADTSKPLSAPPTGPPPIVSPDI